MQKLRRLFVRRDDRGATAVEYGLLVALIAAVMIAGLLLLGPTLQGLYDSATQGW